MKLGINLPDVREPEGIRKWLKRFCDAGFETVEYNSDLFPMIIGEISTGT